MTQENQGGESQGGTVVEDLYGSNAASTRERLDLQAASLRRMPFSADTGLQSIQIQNVISTLEKMSFLVLDLGKQKSFTDSPTGAYAGTCIP